MAIRGYWNRVQLDRDRCLVYGPSLGRLYLVPNQLASDCYFQRLLGLRRFTSCEGLSDPADRIVHDQTKLKSLPVVRAPAWLCAAYRIIHYSRTVIPFSLAIRLIQAASRLSSRTPRRSVSDIGRLVHGIETVARRADCYPRALITAYLCLASGHACDFAVGSLAPTRKMHAWCSAGGELPYEALPEHYMYCPLLVLTLTP